MFYAFICPGMPFTGATISSDKSLGGSETACYYMAREIAARGNRVTVFTTDPAANGQFDGVDYAFCGEESQQFPLGTNAHGFMENAECDALIIQRAAGVHKAPHCGKVALLWLHDLALQRQIPGFRADSYLYDGVLAVSEWHRDQIHDTWGLAKDAIHVVRNAVERSLYTSETPRERKPLRLVYQSRYERGIDFLIAPGGVMDQLAKSRPEASLFVCGYENEPEHMQAYYANVRERIGQMSNVKLMPYMGKAQLAQLQMAMDIMLYPGTFEETSCISAMEAQCAGLPFVGNAVGALPETCGNGGGARLFPLVEGKPDTASMVRFLSSVTVEKLSKMREAQVRESESLSWSDRARDLEALVESRLRDKQRNSFSMLRTMLDRSDIMMARDYIMTDVDLTDCVGELNELAEQYGFAESDEKLAAHYDEDHALVALEEDANLDVTQNARFQFVFEQLKAGNPSHVLDYGCQKGHYIFSCVKAGLAGGVRYVGMDVSQRHIDWASAQFKRAGANTVSFVHDDAMRWKDGFYPARSYDALLLCEVIEHVLDPTALGDRLERVLLDGARVVVSTPYGEWEGKDYNAKPDDKRYHLHHFELSDLHDMFAHHEGFNVVGVPAGRAEHGALGSYVVGFTWRKGARLVNPVNLARKLGSYAPRATVSFCAIVKDAEKTLLRALTSVKDVVDEFVIAIDKNTTDRTREIVQNFAKDHCRFKRVLTVEGDSPLDIGFDAARNRTIDAARGDFVLWMDADEELVNADRLGRYLRCNIFDGYGLAQHHMSAEPAGLLTTDWPVRVFRREPYIRFQGVVHEHPDDIERPNSGPRSPAQITDVCVMHHGYVTETVRRARFQRNFPLIKRDRKQYPNRTLGRMLWMRDLSHMCMFELERSGGAITPQARDVAQQGIKEWEALLENAADPMTGRMLRDGLEFYSTFVKVLGGGFEAQFQMHVSREPGQCIMERGPRRGGWFLSRAHFEKFMRSVYDEQLGNVESKYY